MLTGNRYFTLAGGIALIAWGAYLFPLRLDAGDTERARMMMQFLSLPLALIALYLFIRSAEAVEFAKRRIYRLLALGVFAPPSLFCGAIGMGVLGIPQNADMHEFAQLFCANVIFGGAIFVVIFLRDPTP